MPSRLSVFRHLSFYVMRQIILDRWFLFYPAILWHVLVNLGLKVIRYFPSEFRSIARILVDLTITNPCKRVILNYKGLKGDTREYST